MKPRILHAEISLRRRFTNFFMLSLLVVGLALAILPLLSIFIYVCQQGFAALNWELLSALPKPVGEPGGGLGNAILGSLMLILMAAAAGVPIGILTGIYLSEYSGTHLARIVRFATELLAGVPSIIIGIFAYAVFVVPMKRFSGFAGAAALAVILIPTVARTTEEVLKLVPMHIREAGLALGVPRWKVTIMIVLRGSMGGVGTSIVLGIARIAGETAPLLFTALNSQFWPQGLDQPMPSLPVQIFTYAISPFDEWRQQAWAGALVLVMFVFALNLLTRLILQRQPVAKD